MYNRDIVEVVTEDGKMLQAYAYRISPNLFKQERQEFSKMQELSWKNLIKNFLIKRSL